MKLSSILLAALLLVAQNLSSESYYNYYEHVAGYELAEDQAQLISDTQAVIEGLSSISGKITTATAERYVRAALMGASVTPLTILILTRTLGKFAKHALYSCASIATNTSSQEAYKSLGKLLDNILPGAFCLFLYKDLKNVDPSIFLATSSIGAAIGLTMQALGEMSTSIGEETVKLIAHPNVLFAALLAVILHELSESSPQKTKKLKTS